MKNNYTILKRTLAVFILVLCSNITLGQTVKLTFANSQNTSDGTNDYYEADIMIQTADGMADFKVGSGQIYFNFNTAAFGENVKRNGRFVMETPSNSLAGSTVFNGAANIYGPFIVNDNITSRVSTLFAQALSAGTMPTLNVTATPTLLYHIKFTYVDVSEVPNVTFVETNAELSQAQDQFFTACGPFTSGFAVADCSSAENLGSQIFGAQFDSSGAVIDDTTLSNQNILTDTNKIKILPNPVQDVLHIEKPYNLTLEAIKILSLSGKEEMNMKAEGATNFDVSALETWVYIFK